MSRTDEMANFRAGKRMVEVGRALMSAAAAALGHRAPPSLGDEALASPWDGANGPEETREASPPKRDPHPVLNPLTFWDVWRQLPGNQKITLEGVIRGIEDRLAALEDGPQSLPTTANPITPQGWPAGVSTGQETPPSSPWDGANGPEETREARAALAEDTAAWVERHLRKLYQRVAIVEQKLEALEALPQSPPSSRPPLSDGEALFRPAPGTLVMRCASSPASLVGMLPPSAMVTTVFFRLTPSTPGDLNPTADLEQP